MPQMADFGNEPLSQLARVLCKYMTQLELQNFALLTRQLSQSQMGGQTSSLSDQKTMWSTFSGGPAAATVSTHAKTSDASREIFSSIAGERKVRGSG